MKIVIYGWEYGFQKIPCTRLVRGEFGYSLSEGKRVTDRILAKEEVVFEGDDLHNFAEELKKIGAKFRIEE